MTGVVVMAIGCLECGNPSAVLGHYSTAEAAKEAHPGAVLAGDIGEYEWRGEGMWVIFPLPPLPAVEVGTHAVPPPGCVTDAAAVTNVRSLIRKAKLISPSPTMAVYVGELEVALGMATDRPRGKVGAES